MNKKVSIIVPVYNVEEYLSKCLDSIINQSYKNLEIICVDDGSTDKSGVICDEYAKKDSRIKVYHKTNEGVSSARNLALSASTGDYIGFVDSDDWIEPTMYETLVNAIESKQADIAVCSFSKVYNNKIDKIQNNQHIKEDILGISDILRYAFNPDNYRGFNIGIWNKLFTTKFLKLCQFEENLLCGQDFVFFVEATLKSKSCVYIHNHLYNYYKRNDSNVRNQNLNFRSLALKGYDIAIDKCSDYDEVIWIKRYHCYYASTLAELAYEQGNLLELKKFQNEIRKYLDEYILTNKEKPERIERIHNILNL